MGALKRLLPYLPRVLFVLGTFAVLFTMLDIAPWSSEQDSDTAPAEPTATPGPLAQETPPPTPEPEVIPTPAVDAPIIGALPSVQGRFFTAQAVIDSPERAFEMGFYALTEGSVPAMEYIVRFDGNALYAAYGGADQNGNETVRIGNLQIGTTYRLLIHVLGQGLGGANYYISGGEFGDLNENWRLLWRTSYTSDAEVSLLGIVPPDVDWVRDLETGEVESLKPAVLDLFDFPAEGISRLSGRTLDLASGAAVWETPKRDDSWWIEDGAANSTKSRTFAIVESNTSDGLVSARLNPLNNSGLIVRYSDPDNWIGIRRRGADESLLIVRMEGGQTSEIDSVFMPLEPLDEAILDVFLDGEKIRVHLNGAEVLNIAEPFNQDATKHGLWSFGTIVRFVEFFVWPSGPGRTRG